ncbi:MAG: molecular chaperone DnaK [Candidatus Aminicenantaceae bacterium]
MALAVGIDLGTTFSCIAYLEGSKPQIIPNFEGSPTTPSVVTFASSGEILIGNPALRQAISNPEHTIYAIKRLIGRKYNSIEVSEAKQKMPYELTEAPNGDVMVRVNSKVISPQEISAMILSYLKECAESYFGKSITDVIITVPAHFDDAQRQATKDAAIVAGLNVLRVINEPTAASLAHKLINKRDASIAVYDIGGGTFDITLLETNEGVFNVLATNGNSYLGGEDFDNRILDWLVKEFKKEYKIDLSQDKFALQRIKEASEKAKRELSFALESEINLPFIHSEPSGSKHIKKLLTREKLEELTGDLVEETIPYVKQALHDSKLKPEDVEEIVLVGGQTRMPMIRKVITEFFKKEPIQDVNPDEIVAAGAAIQSGILVGGLKDIVLLDVCPLSLGIETEHDKFVKIIERNSTIPIKKTRSFTTVERNQTRVRIHVLQGERELASENKSLGMFELVGIEPAPAGFPQIDVTFEIDANGIAKASARDKHTGREQKIEVITASGLSKEEINRIIKDAQKYAAQDSQRINIHHIQDEIERLIFTLENYYYKDEESLPPENKKNIKKLLARKDTILQSEELDKLENARKEVIEYINLIKQSIHPSDTKEVIEENNND